MEAIHTTTRSSRAELRADVTALLDAAHHLTSGRVDAPPKWRGEVDLNSLTRDKLEAFLHDRGMTAPPSYSAGDLVTLAKQAKYVMRKSPPETTTSPCGFSLEKRPSRIPGAGDGLFIQGTAKKGTVVGFYPGCVYAESDMPLVYPQIFTGNSYLAFRPDKALLPTAKEKQQHTDDPIDYAKLFSNPFAVGHFANHPPKDTRPNVASLPFDFKEDDFPVCLRRYIPNAHFLPQPATSDAPPRTLVSGLVLVATKDLEDGEELLMDYHYSSSQKGTQVPPWYHPVARSQLA